MPVHDHRLGPVAACGHGSLLGCGACRHARVYAAAASSPSSSARERLEQEPRRRGRIEQQGERPAGAGPRDVGEPPLLLERALRLGGVGDRPAAGKAVGEHDDVVPLEALRPVGGRERQRGVVAAQDREQRATARRSPRGGQARRRTAAPSRGARSRARRGSARPFASALRRRSSSSVRRMARPELAERDEERQARSARPRGDRAAHRAAGPRSGSGRSGARNGRPRSSAATTATSSSRFVRARTARVVSSRRPARHRARGPHDVVVRVRREHESSGRGRPRVDPLGEPLAVVLDEPHGTLDDRSRAAVVGREVDAPEARQRRREAKHAAHVGEAPAVDRLVVVADQEDPVVRRREEQRELQLRPVEVLRLVDEQLARIGRASGARTASSSWSRRSARTTRSSKSTPPDAATARSYCHVRPRDRAGRRVRGDLVGRDPEVELEPREREVEPSAIGGGRRRGTARAAARRGR